MSKLNSKVADTAPVRPVAGTETLEPVSPVAQKIDTEEVTVDLVPYPVDDILDYEVRIAKFYVRNDIRDIRIRNDYFSIAKILQLFSEGYIIIPSNSTEELEPFFQQVILIEFYYGNTPDFKQELKNKNIFPTFIIEHEERGCIGYDYTAILGYCLSKTIENETIMEEIYSHLYKILFNCQNAETAIDFYNAYDYGKITNVTISNNIYVPVEGGIAHV